VRAISHLVILGHPSPDSFNSAVARRYVEAVRANHQEAILRDLYALDFEPRLAESERLPSGGDALGLDARTELELLHQCDVLTFVYPLWFGMPPAIIKGYIDRIFGAGFRLESLKRPDQKLMSGKQLAVLSTSASTRPWLEAQGMWVSLRQSFESYLRMVFGFSKDHHYHAGSIGDDLSPREAERVFYEVEEFARNVCAEVAIDMRQKR
jgi:NAD(P)H dehydrogenase (quinone)